MNLYSNPPFLQDKTEKFFTDILKRIHLSDNNKADVEIYEHHVIAVLNAFGKAKALDEIKRVLGETPT